VSLGPFEPLKMGGDQFLLVVDSIEGHELVLDLEALASERDCRFDNWFRVALLALFCLRESINAGYGTLQSEQARGGTVSRLATRALHWHRRVC